MPRAAIIIREIPIPEIAIIFDFLNDYPSASRDLILLVIFFSFMVTYSKIPRIFNPKMAIEILIV
jgi:hypothetical protein